MRQRRGECELCRRATAVHLHRGTSGGVPLCDMCAGTPASALVLHPSAGSREAVLIAGSILHGVGLVLDAVRRRS